MSEASPDPVYSARLLPDGESFAAPANMPLLQSALQAGIVLESSCRNGTCRSCICLLAGGSVNYRIEWPASAPMKRQKVSSCPVSPTRPRMW